MSPDTTPPHGMQRKFFFADHHPYYIVAPDYTRTSSGIKVLHILCHALNERGYEAYVTANVRHPHLRTPPLTRDIILRHYATGRQPIAVYPETQDGNPLSLPVVARWLLNQPGNLSKATDIAPEDLLFAYAKWVLPEGTEAEELCISPLDDRIFHNRDNPHDQKRQGFCYYANKFLSLGHSISPEIEEKGTRLCQDVTLTQEELAGILRRSALIYCYEHTALVGEAVACGCPVVLLSSDYWQPKTENIDLVGMSIDDDSPETLQRLRAEIDLAETRRAARQASIWAAIDNFIVRTQQEAAAPRRPADPAGGTANLWLAQPSQRAQLLPDISRAYPDDPLPPNNLDSLPAWLAPFHMDGHQISAFIQRLGDWQPHPRYHFTILGMDAHPIAIQTSVNSVLLQSYSGASVTVIANFPCIEGMDPNRVHWVTSFDEYRLPEGDNLWCSFLPAGDQLAPHALLVCSEYTHCHESLAAFHTDSDCHDFNRKFLAPRFHTDYLDWLDNGSRFPGLLMALSEVWQAAGGWPRAAHGLDELEAARRIVDLVGEEGFGHLPGTLRHRFYNQQAEFMRHLASPEEWQARTEAHLQATGRPARAESTTHPYAFALRYPEPTLPSLSIAILTKDNPESLQRCLDSLISQTQYPQIEILIIDNGSQTAQLPAPRAGITLSRHAWARPFNLAAMCNLAADKARGEVLLFLHDDTEILEGDWLRRLATLLLRDRVGAVGPRLVNANGESEPAGTIPLLHGLHHPVCAQINTELHHGQQHAAHRVAALPATALMVKRAVYRQVGGMDEQNFPNRAADTDFCVRLERAGHTLWWTPDSTLVHHSDGSTAAGESDNDALLRKWGCSLSAAPGFNPHSLALTGDPALLPDPVGWTGQLRVALIDSPADHAHRHRGAHAASQAQASGQVRAHRLQAAYPPAFLAALEIDTLHCAARLDLSYLAQLKRYPRSLGCRIVMDLDALGPITSPPSTLDALLGRCKGWVSRFTTGNPQLADDLRTRHGIDIHLTPDLPDLTLCPPSYLPPPEARRRVIWHGEAEDILPLLPVIERTARHIDWVLIGSLSQPLPHALLHLAADHATAETAAELPELINRLRPDIAIVPVAPNMQGAYRSAHDILQYGLLGIPSLISDLPAWHDLPAQRLPADPAGWECALLDPATSTRQIGHKDLHAATKAHCNGSLRAEKWLHAWQY